MCKEQGILRLGSVRVRNKEHKTFESKLDYNFLCSLEAFYSAITRSAELPSASLATELRTTGETSHYQTIIKQLCYSFFPYSFFLYIFLLSPSLFAGNWNLEVKNIQYESFTTRICLISETPINQEISVQLQIKEEKSPAFSIQKKYKLTSSNHTQYLRLGEGNFLIRVIIEPQKGEAEIIERTFFCMPYNAGKMYASDVFLASAPFSNPISSKGFAGKIKIENRNFLYFSEAIQSKNPIVTVRAVLYKEVENRANISKTSTYNSIQQINTILSLSQNQGNFSGKFDIQKLEKGNYLIEVFVYSDKELLSEKSVGFEIVQEAYYWKNSEIDESIRKMQVILSKERVENLLKLPLIEKKAALQNVWSELYPNEGETQAQLFYDKINTAILLYGKDGKGWQGARASTYIRYGEPDEKRTFHTATGDYEGWLYHKWQLAFTFQKIGNEFVLKK